MRKVSYERWLSIFYWTCTTLLRGILWVVGRWEVTGRENVPRTGGCIVVSNHLSNADPPILSAGIARRRLRFMAKIEIFKRPWGLIPEWFGAYPVRRFDADVRALMTSERMLKDGWVLGMFPEGTRSRTGTLGKPLPGTAVIALRSGAPVIPCAMTGTERLRNPLVVFTRPRITVRIGEPIYVERSRKPTEEQVSDLTERIFDAVKALLPQQYVPAYTGLQEAGVATNGRDNPGQ